MKRIFLPLVLSLFICVAQAAKKDACEEVSPTYVTAVLVDVSTPLDQPSLLAYETLVDKLIASSPNHSRFDVYKITEGSTGLDDPVISRCKPASDSMFGDNKVFAGKKYFDKRQKNEFEGPLKKELLALGSSPVGGQSSPILESIYKISLRSFDGKFAPSKPIASAMSGAESIYGGRIIVISDFMQNSKLLNFYGLNIPKYSAWRESVDGRKWVANHSYVEAYAVIIPREKPNNLTVPGRDFFHAYFVSNFKCIRMSDLVTSARSNLEPGTQCKTQKVINNER